MRLVVIGGNAAGLSAAARARRLDRWLEIVVLEKGPVVSYAACGLPYYIEGRVRRLEELQVASIEEFRTKRRIDVRTGAEVAAIRHASREVALAGGERIGYDKLVIATGARPARPGIQGRDAPHVFALQTFADAERLRAFLDRRRARRAAIIGGGYIGLEMTEVLRARGLHVFVYSADDRLLGSANGSLQEALARRLERFGVALHTNRPVRSLSELEVDGREPDLVLLAAGFRPNVELAAEAGVEIGRTGAIRVDERLETNLSGVYAAGDCAEALHKITGRPAYIPLGTTANKMGRVAGANAAGRRERFPGVLGTSIVRVCGLGVGMTGLAGEDARAEGFDAVSARIEALERAEYFWGAKITVELTAERRTGRLLGGLVMGERGVAHRTNVIAAALEGGLGVEEFEMLDLAYTPPYARVWDPVLIAAQQLRKLLS